MLDAMAGHELWRAVTSAEKVWRELNFVLKIGPARLRGKIDLVYRDSAGALHIVDYKSDRLARGAAAARAKRYELQMLIYAAAAGRHVGGEVADATLYFLRAGEACCCEIGAAAPAGSSMVSPAGGEERIVKLARRLIVARRSGEFRPHRSGACDFCPYSTLCGSCL